MDGTPAGPALPALPGDPRLAAFAAALSDLLDTLPASYSAGLAVDGDGTRHYTCDGGAVIAAYVAARQGLDAVVRVGLYWHDAADRIAAMRGDDLGDLGMSADAYAASHGLDEHHHWLELDLDGVTVVYDPNGPARGEPTLQLLTDAVRDRYVPLPDSDPWSRPVYDRRADPYTVIAEVYPDAISDLDRRWPRAAAQEGTSRRRPTFPSGVTSRRPGTPRGVGESRG